MGYVHPGPLVLGVGAVRCPVAALLALEAHVTPATAPATAATPAAAPAAAAARQPLQGLEVLPDALRRGGVCQEVLV